MEIQKVGFIYVPTVVDRYGNEELNVPIPNVMPTVALNYMIGATLKGESQFTTFYLGLFDNNYTPVPADTMTTLIASCGENQAYTGSARQAIVFPAVSAATLSTLADPNIFEFVSGQTIRGAFISTLPTWAGTAGLLVSAVLFPSPKIVAAGESLKVPVGFGLVSA